MNNGDVGGSLRMEYSGEGRRLGIERAMGLAGVRGGDWPRL